MAATSYFGELPPELAVDAQKIARQEAMADAILKRSREPLVGRQAGHFYVAPHPMEGVAQLGAAYFGNQAHQRNEAAMSDLANRYGNMLGEGVQDYMKQRYGTGVQPDPQEIQQSQDYGTPAPAPAQGNPRQAIISAMTSRNPYVRQLGAADYSEMKQNEKPIVVPSDATLTEVDDKGVRRPTVVGAPKKAIPAGWESNLPPGAQRLPTDPAGIFRMKGADGQQDVYAMEFEGGKLAGYKRLDNNFNPNSNAQRPFFSPVSTAGGIYSFDARTGTMKLVKVDEKPVVRETADPRLKGDLAAAAAAGHEQGKLTEDMRQRLPGVIQKAEQQMDLIDKMVGSEDKTIAPHKGFSSYVGFTFRPFASKVHGTPEADFEKLLKQVQGGAFMQAYETLKGGGQITEIEGKKGTEALTRMDKAQSEGAFIEAAREFQEVVKTGIARAKAQAAQSPMAQRPANAVPPPPAGFAPLP